MPPEWVTRLPELHEKLLSEFKTANDGGVFQFSTTFCQVVPELYIRPEGLYKQVTEHLRKGGGVCAVLIWGGMGLGKTSLALDVAHAFSVDKGAREGV